MMQRLWQRLVHFCTFVVYFLVHCMHPAVDMWRVWRSGFEWRSTLHRLYVDTTNRPPRAGTAAAASGGEGGSELAFDPMVDFATVVGSTTGVGFEVAAGLAACGLSVIAGMRGSPERLSDVSLRLAERALALRQEHGIGQRLPAPAIIPLHVDVADFTSGAKFAAAVAHILRDGDATQSIGAAPSSRVRDCSVSATPRGRSASASARRATLSGSSNNNSNSSTKQTERRRLLRVALLNAAVLMTDFERTPQGFEAQVAINALGHIVIAEHLLQLGVFGRPVGGAAPSSPSDAECRLIFTSSSGARVGDPLRGTFVHGNELIPGATCQFQMYGDSKALIASYAKLLHTRVVRAMLDGVGPRLSVRAYHPGCIASNIVLDSGMYAAAVLAWLQRTIGVAIGAMVTAERASVYVMRMCVGSGGRLVFVPPGDARRNASATAGKCASPKLAVARPESHPGVLTRAEIVSGEEEHFFSYLHEFDPLTMARFLRNEQTLKLVHDRVTHDLAVYLPEKKSVLDT